MLPPTLKDRSVCIVGLGYVGLTLAVAMADAGFRVHGVEVSDAVLAPLAQGRAHFVEVGLDHKLAEQVRLGRFTFGPALGEAAGATTYIVTVGTPVSDDKRVRFDSLEQVARGIAGVLRPDDMVILRSTVMVGTTRDFVKPILDAAGVPYALAFCPERTLEGRALAELKTLPQVVGGIDAESTFRASQLFSFLTPSVVRVNDSESAELVKLINNTQRDYTFALANEVAAICDHLGLSAAEVIASGNLGYARANLPMPGPVGGPCLEKDPYILAQSLEGAGFTPALAVAARRWNEGLPERTVELVARALAERGADAGTVAVLGLAFKGRPETGDLRGTLAKPLVDGLRRRWPAARLVGWDPVVDADGIASLGLEPRLSAQAAFAGADAVVIQNNHEAFAKMDLAALTAGMRSPGVVYDLWSQHDPRALRLAPGVTYHALGAFGLHAAAVAAEAA
jgi:UDP-N-acetyl-D-mannosaminuronic acid dehydrogenase